MNSIEQDIKRNLGKSRLPKNVANRIRSKLEILRGRYGINFDSTVIVLEKCPDLYKQLNGLPGLSTFFRRHIDIWLEYNGCSDLLFSKSNNCWVTAARVPNRIAVHNPESEKIESWSRIESVSKWRCDHFRDANAPKKSKFNGNLSYVLPIEFAAFNNGIGLLVKRDLMRIYLGFEEPIGKSAKGKLQKYICLECKRIRRRQNTKAKDPKKIYGFKVEIHGYPVSESDIRKDFKGISLKSSEIPIIPNTVHSQDQKTKRKGMIRKR